MTFNPRMREIIPKRPYPHRPDYYLIQTSREDPQCSEDTDRSQALTWIQQQNKKTAYDWIDFGNLLNILIDRHLKLLYFKVPNRPAPEWHTTQALPYDQRKSKWCSIYIFNYRKYFFWSEFLVMCFVFSFISPSQQYR